jgi:hypothetical protein
MLAVARKQRSTFRNYVAAETAAPVIACATGKGPLDELDYQFAGIVRSNSVRTMDDGVGECRLCAPSPMRSFRSRSAYA